MPHQTKIQQVAALPLDIQRDAVYLIDQPNPNRYTHGMFKYPCKFIPELPRWAIRKYLDGAPDLVLDPFAGSGTTLLEANLHGCGACGTEIDDIAKLIIEVKTTRLSPEQLDGLDRTFERLCAVLDAEQAETFSPAIDNLAHWFSPEALRVLGRLRPAIEQIGDPALRNFFRLCLVSIVKRVSNADDTSPKPYVSNKIIKTPPPAEKEFASVFRRYREMEEALSAVQAFGESRILPGDALHFSLPEPAGLAVTSPPYINAFDYGRTMRLENLWLATLTEAQLRQKKGQYVGTEKIRLDDERGSLEILGRSPRLQRAYEAILPQDEKRALIVKRFFADMEQNLRTVERQLKPGGHYVIVIGNSTIRGVTVESARILEELAAGLGFTCTDRFSYLIQNPYLRIPRGGRGGKINQDFVIALQKGASHGTERPLEAAVADPQAEQPDPDRRPGRRGPEAEL